MKFPRSKKLLFCNNKGGVGKTTLAYNCAAAFAEKGYKTVLVDLDPQCNSSVLALGADFYEENLLSSIPNNIYHVLRGFIDGGSDVDMSVNFTPAPKVDNLYILPGSLELSRSEDFLSFNITQAMAGNRAGYLSTSAINRFLVQKGMDHDIDIYVIDTSPSLGFLNRVIFLGADYFVVPMMPDSFSLQGIQNLGTVFEKWKREWKNTAKSVGLEIESKFVLPGEATFIGYIVNSYNVYGKQPIKNHRDWMSKIPDKVKYYLSEKHSRNGLVEQSWKTPVQQIQDYGKLAPLCQLLSKPIIDIMPNELGANEFGTKENLEKAKQEFDVLSSNILGILEKY